MHLAALAIIALSFVAGIAEFRSSDPAGRLYALLIPVIFGHLVALVPALLAWRSSPSGGRQRYALLYVLCSVLGIVPALLAFDFIPLPGPPPAAPPPPVRDVGAALLGMVNAQRPFEGLSIHPGGGRSLTVVGLVPSVTDYERLAQRIRLFVRGFDSLSLVRIDVGISDGGRSEQPCRWTQPNESLVVECLCGSSPPRVDPVTKAVPKCSHEETPPN